MATTTTTAPLLSAFPAEILNKILENLLVVASVKLAIVCTDEGETRIVAYDTTIDASILRASKQFHHTGTAMLYVCNNFVICHTPLVLKHWFKQIGKKCRLVRSIDIRCTRDFRHLTIAANELTKAHDLTHLKMAYSITKYPDPPDMATLFADWMRNIIIKRYKSGKKPGWAVLSCINFYHGEGGHPLPGEDDALTAICYTIAVRLELRKLLGEDWVAKTADFTPTTSKGMIKLF